MKKRNIVYLTRQKALARKVNKMIRLYCGLNAQASFPDSGYYYEQKQGEFNDLYDSLKKVIPAAKLAKIEQRMYIAGEQAYYNYCVKVQVVGEDGREWTAQEMDAEMCNC